MFIKKVETIEKRKCLGGVLNKAQNQKRPISNVRCYAIPKSNVTKMKKYQTFFGMSAISIISLLICLLTYMQRYVLFCLGKS